MAAITVAFLLHRYSLVTSESTGAGIHLFQTLSLAELFLIVFVTPASIAGAISGERQHRTWDLLVSSPSSMASIVWGKLLAGVVFNLVLLAATLPFFALIFLFGGMTAGDMVPAFLVFLVTVVLLAALSLAVSALTARLTVSYMVSMLLALFLAVGISLVTLYVEASGQLGPLASRSAVCPPPYLPPHSSTR
jgi:ABC-type transport system involved in multi-copper enzyme maturation permease subunit